MCIQTDAISEKHALVIHPYKNNVFVEIHFFGGIIIKLSVSESRKEYGKILHNYIIVDN